jgi:hypothetical protein
MPFEPVPEHYELGRRQCADDIAIGRVRLFFQTRGRWGEFLTQRMADRFGVEVEHSSDMVTEAELSFQAGYNDATQAHIERTFGPGSYREVLDETDRFRTEQYRRTSDERGDER